MSGRRGSPRPHYAEASQEVSALQDRLKRAVRRLNDALYEIALRGADPKPFDIKVKWPKFSEGESFYDLQDNIAEFEKEIGRVSSAAQRAEAEALRIGGGTALQASDLARSPLSGAEIGKYSARVKRQPAGSRRGVFL